jgi:2-dehydro-3-deoxy-D-gluconate 5-dehydrogenase
MILDQFKLEGKVAVVTGAGRGLGQAMALGLAEAGADLAVVGSTTTEETARKVRGLGRKVCSIEANLLHADAVARIVDATLADFGHIDILVNNAGITRRASVLDLTEQDWDEVIHVNQRSLFFLSQAVGKHMVQAGRGGKIIHVASMLSFQGGIRVAAYTASKSAVMGLTRIMANELAPLGINVNAIAPGYMSTELTAPLRDDEKRNAEILGRIPAGRWGTPEDLQGAVVFLASRASDYMHGYTIAVDGGWLSR